MASKGRWRAATCAALLAWLAGCGGGGGADDVSVPPEAMPPPAPSANYFPLDAGARWVYASGSTEARTLRWVNGSANVDGATALVVDEQALPGEVSAERSAYVAAADGVREYTLDTRDPILQALNGLLVMKWPSSAGERTALLDRTLDSDTDFDGDARPDRVRIRAELQTVGFETVTVPAGTFAACLHQRLTLRLTVQPSGGGADRTLLSTVDTWYAEGIGPVRSDLRVDSAGSVIQESETLTAYRVADRTNDAQAPSVQSVSPATAVARASTLMVSVTVNELVDPRSAASALRVRDADGRVVPGSVSISGPTVSFSPDVPWSAGRYEAELGTELTDLLGRPVAAPYRWSFEADAVAPVLVRSEPSANATEVALDGQLRLWFAEPLDVATANPGTIELTTLSGDAPVPISVAVDGPQLILTPLQPMQRGTTYRVLFFGVTDRVGNAVPNATVVLSFATTQNGFAMPVALAPPSSVNVNVAADFDGDGHVDLVHDFFATPGTNEVSGLQMRRGLGGGAFGPPVALDGGIVNGCRIKQMATGDFDADGRVDVAVLGCGLQILNPTTEGRLVPGVAFHVGIDRLRRVDLDSDGRDDLVGVILDRGEAYAFTQAGGSGLVQQPPIALGFPYANELATGDIDGDGRTDLVVLRSGFDQQVGLLRQRPDGRFSAPSFLNVPSGGFPGGVDVGDLDGDGHADIVVSMGGNAPTQVWLLRQMAGGGFTPAQALPTLDNPGYTRIVDISGDGRLDLLVVHQGFQRIGLYRQRSDGSLGSEELFWAGSEIPPAGLDIADLDGDGWLDVLHAGVWLRQIPDTASRGLQGGPLRRALRGYDSKPVPLQPPPRFAR